MHNDESHLSDVGERNVERLLGAAYRPEDPDPAFVRELNACLRAEARARAVKPSAPAKPDEGRLRPVRRRLGWAMGLAASVAAVALVHYATQRRASIPADRPGDPAHDGVAVDGRPVAHPGGEPSFGLVPRPRAEAPAPKPLAVGAALGTRPGERRRVTLADGSVLYLNQNTRVTQTAARRLALESGEVYLEVAPREQGATGATFVVETPQRKVTALGTRFGVRAAADGTGVVVTQGKVRVAGVSRAVHAGQQLTPGADEIKPAPRASHQLDWTRELMAAAESPLVPCSQHAGGALIAVDPSGQEVRLTLRKYHIDVHIEDGFARTTIDQTYFNNEHAQLEGTFYFPLPPDASLSRLAMYVDAGNGFCTLMEGGMAEANLARNAYETIRYARRDPALLEWVDGSTFKMRVFPLQGRQEKRILLSYSQRLDSLYGVARYRFPGEHNMDYVKDWSFTARVKGGAGLHCSSPTHPALALAPKDGDMTLSLHEKHVKPDRDVALEIAGRAPPFEAPRFATFTHENARYLMVRYLPYLEGKPRRERRDWVILFESAANRDPLLARAQVEIVRGLLENAEHDDTFHILTAGTRVHRFDAQARPNAPQNAAAAVKFLENTHLIGALDLANALKEAAPLLKAGKNPYLVHVGAGVPAMGERGEDALTRLLPEGVRYVGVGVGKRWNRSFFKLAAERTGGYFTQINPDEPLAWRAFELLATLNTPRLLELRVVDDTERASFLCDAVSLAQGEEVCAIARIEGKDSPLPENLTVTGKLDGKLVVRRLPVKNVAGGAGYLPRTWAKREIDRLLADGGEKHKAKVIELSKAMYVMSPYTSLLVLETEADYKRFKVDRGRKDHWAMYAAPAKIPVVYEPLPHWQQAQAPKAGAKPSAEQVLQSVLVRVRLQHGKATGRLLITATEYYNGAYALTGREFRLGEFGDKAPIDPSVVIMDGSVRAVPRDVTTWTRGALGPRRRPVVSPYINLLRAGEDPAVNYYRMIRPGAEEEGERASPGQKMPPLRHRLQISAQEYTHFLRLSPERMSSRTDLDLEPEERAERARRRLLMRLETLPPAKKAAEYTRLLAQRLQLERGDQLELALELEQLVTHKRTPPLAWRESGEELDIKDLNGFAYYEPALALVVRGKARARTNRFAGLTDGEAKEVFDLVLMDEIAEAGNGLPALRPGRSLLYQRPGYTRDWTTFGDLVSYAPGLHTTVADLQAVLEAETSPRRGDEPGVIDPEARALVEKARRGGWQALTFPGRAKHAGTRLVFNAAGQYALDHVLASGLREVVVCDGSTLLHLYPEIGLGARRTVSRFHREGLLGVLPWLLPPADDLARGFDLKRVDERTVALTPRGAAERRATDGKPIPYAELRLVFAEDGRLCERRLVHMPEGKVVARETYGADGSVRAYAGDVAKPAFEHTLALSAAQAPNLKPDVSKLVVVPMPLRTREHIQQRPSAAKAGGDVSKWDADDAIAVIATDCASQSGWSALVTFVTRFHNRGDRRLGFYTLLASCGVGFGPQGDFARAGAKERIDVAREHPREPLARYLAAHFRIASHNDPSGLNLVGGPEAGFVQRLATLRELCGVWERRETRGDVAKTRAAVAKAVAFAKDAPPPMAWTLLNTVRDHLGAADHATLITLAEASRAAAEAVGYGYSGRYEYASALFSASRGAEARAEFRKLYADALKAGVLPRIDITFRNALTTASKGEVSWAALMRQTARQLTKEHSPAAVLVLAEQLHQLGDSALAEEAFGIAQETAPAEERRLIALAGVRFLAATGQHARAAAQLDPLLKDEKLARSAALWRLAYELASRRNLPGRAVAYLEKALDLEYRGMPDVVNLQRVREDYGKLLTHYQQVANALPALDAAPNRAFLAKVVRAADRWRSLDPDATAACQAAGRILRAVGAKDLAWDYLTTPIGLSPNQAAPWVTLAGTLRDEGEFELADRAYATAFAAEQTNAQILWERARTLHMAGRLEEARAAYRQLAEGAWQERFQEYRRQAQAYLEGR